MAIDKNSTGYTFIFSIAMVALNLWLLISIMVRLVRIKIKVHWERQQAEQRQGEQKQGEQKQGKQ